jgi:hypothetical protein
MLKQPNLTATLAEDSHSVTVATELKMKRSIETQEELFEGRYRLTPSLCSWCIDRI